MRIRSAVMLFALGLGLSPAHAQTVGQLSGPDGPSTTAASLDGPPVRATMPPLPNNAVQLRIQSNRALTLQDAVNTSLGNSPTLLIARIAVERAEAVKRQAEAGLFPTVSLSGGYSYNQSPQAAISRALVTGSSTSTTDTTAVTQSLIGPGLFNSTQAAALTGLLFGDSSSGGVSSAFLSESAILQGQVRIDWNIFTSGLVGSRILAAEENLQAARLDYERTRQDLINNVIGAYYDLQAADGNVQIGDAAVKSAEASLNDARAQERAGVGTRFAVLQAETQLANSVQQRLTAVNQREINQRNLARALNFQVPTTVEAADPVEETGTWQLGLDETIYRALYNRVELAQQDALRRAAKANEAVAYASVAPQVSIFATGDAYDNLLDRIVGIYTGYSAGAQIRWNAFDGGLAAAQAAQAVADAKTAEARFVDTYNTIRFSVESSISSLETARQRVDSATAAVASATEALRLARLRFQAGVGTQTDVITSDRDLTQARVNRLIAVIDYNRALAAIRRSVGIL
ncbi:MAG: TolC family protein [Aphanocapsa lilacina HA4352-LM1]|nr:TolC family protein [Aphanocapsa lilacina HA4352-LM1]